MRLSAGPARIWRPKALLDENSDPDVAEIRDALSGSLCRCTGYSKMIEAVQEAARDAAQRRPEQITRRASLRDAKAPWTDETKVWSASELDSRVARRRRRRPAAAGGRAAEAFPIEPLMPMRASRPARSASARRVRTAACTASARPNISTISASPACCYAQIKRAGIASARIKRIDTSAAEAMPGVMAVVTGKEIPVNSFGPSFQDQPVLADELVCHAGDGVAAVAAVTEQIADEALDKIVVEYEPLPAVFDPVDAMREDAPRCMRPTATSTRPR